MPQFYPSGNQTVWLLQGLAAVILFFASLLAHELAHSFVAIRGGVQVREVTLYIFGGAAHLEEEPLNPVEEIKMALAGPITSFALALLCYLFSLFVFRGPAAAVFYVIALANLGLGTFNILPAFPLDGGRVLRALVWMYLRDRIRATVIAYYASLLVAAGLFLLAGYLLYIGLREALWLVFIVTVMISFAVMSARASIMLTLLELSVDEADRMFHLLTPAYDAGFPEVSSSARLKDLLRRKEPYFVVRRGGEGFILDANRTWRAIEQFTREKISLRDKIIRGVLRWRKTG